MADKSGRHKQGDQPPSDDVLLAKIEVRHTATKFVGAFFIIIAFAVVVLACWPAATVLAGQETVVNVTVALGVTVTVSIAFAGTAMWGHHQKRRADRLDRRNRELSRDVKELKRRLGDAGLDDTVSR